VGSVALLDLLGLLEIRYGHPLGGEAPLQDTIQRGGMGAW